MPSTEHRPPLVTRRTRAELEVEATRGGEHTEAQPLVVLGPRRVPLERLGRKPRPDRLDFTRDESLVVLARAVGGHHEIAEITELAARANRLAEGAQRLGRSRRNLRLGPLEPLAHASDVAWMWLALAPVLDRHHAARGETASVVRLVASVALAQQCKLRLAERELCESGQLLGLGLRSNGGLLGTRRTQATLELPDGGGLHDGLALEPLPELTPLPRQRLHLGRQPHLTRARVGFGPKLLLEQYGALGVEKVLALRRRVQEAPHLVHTLGLGFGQFGRGDRLDRGELGLEARALGAEGCQLGFGASKLALDALTLPLDFAHLGTERADGLGGTLRLLRRLGRRARELPRLLVRRLESARELRLPRCELRLEISSELLLTARLRR